MSVSVTLSTPIVEAEASIVVMMALTWILYTMWIVWSLVASSSWALNGSRSVSQLIIVVVTADNYCGRVRAYHS